MTQTTIQVDGKFWNRNGNGWSEIPESAISYGIWTRQPSRERIAAMQSEIRAAVDADYAAAEAAGYDFNPMTILEMPMPNRDAVIARLGDEYEAMAAYQHFFECCAESAHQ